MPPTGSVATGASHSRYRLHLLNKDAQEARASRPATTAMHRWPIAGLLVLMVTLHAGSIARPFFADDYLFLEQVRGRSLPAALAAPDPIGNFLRPVSRAFHFWWLGHVSGESAAAFHVVNLALFAVALLLFFAIARRVAGARAAVFAFAFVALQSAADVPLRWASGSQDLLAIVFALLAVWWFMRGASVWAALALVLALFSKETVALAGLVAMLAGRRRDESLPALGRRAWPLLAVTAAWAVLWLLWRRAHPAAGGLAPPSLGDVLASLVHLLQTVVGLEWRLGGDAFGHWNATDAWVALAAGALAYAGLRERDTSPAPGAHSLAFVWLTLAWLPTVTVAAIWSGYFYLWAMFASALALGLATRRLPAAAQAAVLALLVLGSAQVRRLDEFSTVPGAWSVQSHVNRHSIERSLHTLERYLAQVRAAYPVFPANSTVYFAEVPVAAGWQAADGPLLRWAYRDPTLRSYFLTQFTAGQSTRGPLYFFVAERDSLVDHTRDPRMLPSLAFSMMIADKPQAARGVLDLVRTRWPQQRVPAYWRAWVRWTTGDTSGAKHDLADAGFTAIALLPAGALALTAAPRVPYDTLARIAALEQLKTRAALAPDPHARLAALYLDRGPADAAALEAYAFRALAPGDPDAWRKWAAAQLAQRQYAPALATLEHVLALTRAAGLSDPEAERVVVDLRRVVRGDVAQKALR